MDDDSLSRRAADFVAEWNWRTTIERLNESRTPHGGGGYSGGGGSGGGSSAGPGSAIVTVLLISAIAGGFGGLVWNHGRPVPRLLHLAQVAAARGSKGRHASQAQGAEVHTERLPALQAAQTPGGAAHSEGEGAARPPGAEACRDAR